MAYKERGKVLSAKIACNKINIIITPGTFIKNKKPYFTKIQKKQIPSNSTLKNNKNHPIHFKPKYSF